jgi:hypothetical protein
MDKNNTLKDFFREVFTTALNEEGADELPDKMKPKVAQLKKRGAYDKIKEKQEIYKGLQQTLKTKADALRITLRDKNLENRNEVIKKMKADIELSKQAVDNAKQNINAAKLEYNAIK